MDCREVEEQFDAYLLGALESKEIAGVERHIESCPECSFRLHREGAIVSELAYAVPQLEVPSRAKSRLLYRIGQAVGEDATGARGRDWHRLLPAFGRTLAAHSGLAVASVLVGFIVVGGAWFNDRLGNVEMEKAALEADLRKAAQSQPVFTEEAGLIQIEPVLGVGSEANDVVKEQRYRLLTFLAGTPGTSTNVLLGTERSSNSYGMLVAQSLGRTALLIAFEMPVPPEGRSYHVWLVKGGHKYSAGPLPVDSTGYGQAIIPLNAPLSYFDAIVITETNKDAGDTSSSGVMRGDL